MRFLYFDLLLVTTCLIGLCFSGGDVFAAQPVALRHQPVSSLKSFMTPSASLKVLNETADFNRTTHIHLQQTFQGYPVHGGTVILHIPLRDGHPGAGQWQSAMSVSNSHSTLNGMLYKGLEADLRELPSYVFSTAQTEKAKQQVTALYQKQSGTTAAVSAMQSDLMVYLDDDNRAHWAFHIRFDDMKAHAKPNYIIDALSFAVYQTWNNLQTLEETTGGGFGGNEISGRIVYDNLSGHYPALTVLRDAGAKLCYLQNTDVTVKDHRYNDAIVQFACAKKSSAHNQVYWNVSTDAVNGAYSPSNDALYIGRVVKEMYQKWYGVPVLTAKGKPMMLNMVVHEDMENAYWDGEQMSFGDGGDMFYPFVSLGVGAHEISHGFTEQHADLEYHGQSGGLNESFSDMASQAGEYYSTGKSSWRIGPEIMKQKGQALRYMDEPTKDCGLGESPGYDCSISQVKDYFYGVNVHYSSGIFNKVFYLMSTSEGWDTKKAFDVMVHANTSYWTATETFQSAACGVLDAAKDYGYKPDAIIRAITTVGLDSSAC